MMNAPHYATRAEVHIVAPQPQWRPADGAPTYYERHTAPTAGALRVADAMQQLREQSTNCALITPSFDESGFSVAGMEPYLVMDDHALFQALRDSAAYEDRCHVSVNVGNERIQVEAFRNSAGRVVIGAGVDDEIA